MADIGLAKNKFIASAVIFSRLYAIYSTSPSVKSSRASLDDNLPQHLHNLREENANMGIGTLITHTHWRLAFEAALYLGGEHPDDLGAVIMASSLETWSRQ